MFGFLHVDCISVTLTELKSCLLLVLASRASYVVLLTSQRKTGAADLFLQVKFVSSVKLQAWFARSG